MLFVYCLLFPAVKIGLQFRYLVAMEGGIFDTLTLLLTVVVKQAEDIGKECCHLRFVVICLQRYNYFGIIRYISKKSCTFARIMNNIMWQWKGIKRYIR